jgi:hypothetical protein
LSDCLLALLFRQFGCAHSVFRILWVFKTYHSRTLASDVLPAI